MRISLFRSERDNEPAGAELSWGELVERLRTPRRTPCTPADCPGKDCPHKFGLAWSPVAYRAGTRRGLPGVEAVSALVLDLDDLTDAQVNALVVSLAPFSYVFHASHTDRPGSRRLRAVVALSREVPAFDWPRFWATATHVLGLPADPATKDASRLFFTPSRPTGADYAFGVHEGFALDVDWVLSQAAPEPIAPTLGAGLASDADAIPSGSRNGALTSIAGKMRSQGLDAEAIRPALHVVNQQRCRPPLDEAEVDKIVDSVGRYEPYADAAYGAVARDLLLPGVIAQQHRVTPVTGPRAMRVAAAATLDKPPIRTYATGFADLDELLGGGAHSRQLCALIGPPSCGKSALAVSLARGWSQLAPLFYVSTELESDELAARFAAPGIPVAWRSIFKGEVDRARVAGALQLMPNVWVLGCELLPRDGDEALQLVASEAITIGNSCGAAPIVVLDYLQDLVRNSARDVRIAAGDLATKLRIIAQRVDCAIVPVCSVSRTYYGKAKFDTAAVDDDATVYLAAAKESGDIDYAAAAIVFLDVEPPRDGGLRDARLAVARARLGRSGFAGARFDGALGLWTSDPTAVTRLSADARAERKRTERDDSVRTWVLAQVDATATDPLSMTSLANRPGCSKTDAAAMIKLLLADGVLAEVDGYFRNGPGGTSPQRKKVVVRTGSTAHLPAAPAEPVAPPPHLAGFLANLK